MTDTVTISFRDLGLVLTPPQNFVEVAGENHVSYLDYGAVVQEFDLNEYLEDLRDLEATRQLYETAGVAAFVPHRVQHKV
jgi:hypothetical protein